MINQAIRPANAFSAIREFLRLETASGTMLIIAAGFAILLANSPLANLYDGLLTTYAGIYIGPLSLEKPFLLWINDGLMAIFFLLIGLEVKREILDGELSNISQITLPAVAAVGGIVVPVLIYAGLNWQDPLALNGWAIPAATDIAFALGILSLLGSRVPTSLKVFLLTLAIIDDLAAIIIIAIFFTSDLSIFSLILAAIALLVLAGLNFLKVTRITAYMIVGILLWIFVLKSGVHATLAGVALAFAIPLRLKNEEGHSPLRHLEHTLHPWVAFGILPLFAMTNAGVSLSDVSLETLLQPVPLGIALGLFVGKQIGIFSFAWLGVKAGLAQLPDDMNWSKLYGVAILCGVGFTMSLFIGSLAFEHGGPDYAVDDRLGILAGSLLSAILGYFFLYITLKGQESE